jgi:hypothetical protein
MIRLLVKRQCPHARQWNQFALRMADLHSVHTMQPFNDCARASQGPRNFGGVGVCAVSGEDLPNGGTWGASSLSQDSSEIFSDQTVVEM